MPLVQKVIAKQSLRARWKLIIVGLASIENYVARMACKIVSEKLEKRISWPCDRELTFFGDRVRHLDLKALKSRHKKIYL